MVLVSFASGQRERIPPEKEIDEFIAKIATFHDAFIKRYT